MDRPLVSVIVPVYNGSKFLRDSLSSILRQSLRDLELIAVDDGSSDGSAEILEEFARADPRVRLLRQPRQGAHRARNAGILAARGAFVAHLDQDNVALENRLEVQLDWMRKRSVDVCGSCTWNFGDADYLGWVPERHEDICVELLFRTAMILSTVVMPVGIARANPFAESAAYGGFELLTRLAVRHRLGNVPQVLVRYRLHPGQRTRLLGDAIHEDRLRYRRRLFHDLFPDSSEADCDAVGAVADGRPPADSAQELLARSWMERISRTTCPTLRSRMIERWRIVSALPLTA